MKKVIGCILCTFFIGCSALAQDNENASSHKVPFIGGNFGLAFGDYTFINLSPQIGYRFNRFFAAGAGINFEYYRKKDQITVTEDLITKFGLIGLNVFGRIYPVDFLMLQIQPEANYKFGSITDHDYSTQISVKNTERARIVPSFLAGGGVVLPANGGAFIFSVMFDVLNDADSPYGRKPVVNIGYNFNLR